MRNHIIILFAVLLIVTVCATFSNGQDSQNSLNDILPSDQNVTIGKLENGLTYYIRQNNKPEKRAELRLVVNAGSVLEDEDQRGIAHFVEHMAFNGTRNFAKQEIIDYLESIGMSFGPDINAYTSFDETVYMLQVPTDSTDVLGKAFQILEDWAHNISFENEEIEKERGVAIEEWRLGRGAGARMSDKQFPILFNNSRYADRLPIGQMDIIATATHETILRFYQDWYRPDLMAVIAIGDFDKSEIEDLIHKHFSGIKAADDVRERAIYPVPNHEETLFAIASDVEATGSNVSIYYKQELSEQKTFGAYRNLIIEIFFNSMLNNRLNELLQNPEPPFLYGYSSKGSLIRSKEFFILGAGVKDNGIVSGLAALLTEANRVKQHGFTQTELDREKIQMLRGMERAFNERDKTESHNYAAEYIRNFLTEEPMPGIELEYELYNKYIPGIQLNEINQLVNEWITDQSRVILVSTPEKDEITILSEKDLLAVFESVSQADVSPYEDSVPDLPLIEISPIAGEIVMEEQIEELGVTQWILSNSVRVVLKPTDFKNDEILLTSHSPGGYSLISDENYVAAISASALIREAGVGKFNQIELQKKLSGKIVRLSPWINDLEEGLSGSVSPQDLETMFQLIYLYFTAPRKDSTAFLSFQSRIRGFIENRHASPDAAFQDTIQVTMSDYHFRTRPWSEAILDEMNLETSFRIFQDRFADASDFTFFFVGNFELESIKPLVQTYLANLPSVNRRETWKDVGIDPPGGVIEKTVEKGLEPKSRVNIIFSGPFDWNPQNVYDLNSMIGVMRIKLREVLREDLGGTYGVGVWASSTHYPDEEYSINITFGCAPERVDELTETVFLQIDSLKVFGTTEKYLTKVKETQVRSRETDLKENRFWLNALRSHYYHQQDPLEILQFNSMVENLTLADIKNAGIWYFDTENYVKLVLYPEN